jgi:hypothetical protein
MEQKYRERFDKKKIQGEMGFWVPRSYETIPPFPSLSLLQVPGFLFLLAGPIQGCRTELVEVVRRSS